MLALFDAMMGELGGSRAQDLYDPAASGSLVEAMPAHLPPDSPVPAYLRRMLLAGGGPGRELFGRLFIFRIRTRGLTRREPRDR